MSASWQQLSLQKPKPAVPLPPLPPVRRAISEDRLPAAILYCNPPLQTLALCVCVYRANIDTTKVLILKTPRETSPMIDMGRREGTCWAEIFLSLEVKRVMASGSLEGRLVALSILYTLHKVI